MSKKFAAPSRREIRNPWYDKPKGRGRRFPIEWHTRTKRGRALGRAIFASESAKDLAIRLKIVYEKYDREVS